MPDFIVGSPVRGENFWFRKAFVEDLWESLKNHNVLVLAPRRIGKTSIMYRMLDYPKEHWLVIHLNVEDIQSPGDFFIALIAALNEHQPSFLRKMLEATQGFLGKIAKVIESVELMDLKVQLHKAEEDSRQWQEKLQQLLDRVLQSGEQVLFIIDELPDMLNNMMHTVPDEYERFLHWFRKIRQQSLEGKVRWLVGGSVNLVAILNQKGMAKLINDLKIEPLSPFSAEEVRKYVEEMFRQEGVLYDATVLQRMEDLLGAPIPLFLQMLTQEIYRFWKHNPDKPVTADTVTTVFNKTLLGEMARDKFLHYRSRIALYYPLEEREAAIDLLNKLSISTTGVSNSALFGFYNKIEQTKSDRKTGSALHQAFQNLLMYLESDFYITQSGDDSYDFSSRLLKAWWKKYYGFASSGD